MKKTTYLDNLTVTPLRIEAERALMESLRQGYSHPRSSNLPGRQTQKVLDDLRDHTARFFGGSRVYFHYDGDVANNLSLLSAGRLARESGKSHIAVSPVERSSVVAAMKILRNEGSTVSVLELDKNGKVIPESLSVAISEETGLVSCAWVNGISGIVQPVDKLAKIAHSVGARFHSDACDAAGRIVIDISDSDIDFITVCSLKIGGPPGAAAVVMSDEDPWLMSAVPEYSPMTNIPGISGMVAAIDILATGIEPRSRIVNQLRSDFLSGFRSLNIRHSIIGDSLDNILPGTALLNIRRVPEKLHLKLEQENIILPSHNSTERLSYLNRMGLDISNPEQYLGFSIDPLNTSVDIEHFLRSLSAVFQK